MPKAANMSNASMENTESLDFAFSDPANLDDRVFFPGLARIRESQPVFWSDLQKGWLLTSHHAVTKAFSDRRFSAIRLHVSQFLSIPEDERDARIPNLMKYIPQWVINVDGAQHSRMRKLVAMAFTRSIVEALRPTIQGYVDALLDEVEKKEEFDFIEDVAFPLPAMVIAELFGLPHKYLPQLQTWAVNLTTALASMGPSESVLLAAEQTLEDMNGIIGEEIRKRRIEPRDDLLSGLINAHDESGSLSEDELLGISHVLLIAGHDTTANSLGLGVAALVRNPEQRRAYLARPVAEGALCMQELFRYFAMSSAQIRIMLEDVELEGAIIPAGSIAFLMIAAANRDPTIFPNPDMLDFDRDCSASTTFGPGFHFCIGHLLARTELDMLFRSFFERFGDVELLDPRPNFTPNYAFRGFGKLPMRVKR
jgi:pimeloyl-[acyl-carrier protein] synthase